MSLVTEKIKLPFYRIALAVMVFLVSGSIASASENSRFFHDGDGRLRLVSEKNGKVFEGTYRHAGGDYNQIALQKIYQVFGAPYEPNAPRLSLRLIAFIDHLEDRLNPGAMLTITSGYRSPEYNKSVRARGGLAAKASLHQYGMAVDMVMEGVPSEQVWNTVKSLEFGDFSLSNGSCFFSMAFSGFGCSLFVIETKLKSFIPVNL